MAIVKRRRVIRRRRPVIRRRKYGRVARRRLGRRSVRVRRSRRRFAALPNWSKRDYSGISNLSNYYVVAQETPTVENSWYHLVFTQAQLYPAFVQLWKEYRLAYAVIAVRRRNPQAVVYSTSSGSVTASRVESNNIWWAPWAKYDPPVQPPRMVRSAVLLTERWTVRKLANKCPYYDFSWQPPFGTSTDISGVPDIKIPSRVIAASLFDADTTTPTSSEQSLLKTFGQFTARWRSVPFQSVDTQEQVVHCGFFCTENKSAIQPDLIEVCARVVFQMRGRKNLGTETDSSGAFDAAEVVEFSMDQRGTAPPKLRYGPLKALPDCSSFKTSNPTDLHVQQITCS
ncbi:putative capsid protein [Pacific flying fox faeces associated circular DNA virus-10]|nr:putative capsid protein [Pacific flying fox faeces associated circular DNA virus-10]